MVLPEFVQGFGTVSAQRDVEPRAFAHRPDKLADGTIVIDDQQRRAWWGGDRHKT